MEIEKGRVYKVKEDSFCIFEPDDIVVASEDCDIPYCIKLEDFNGSLNTDDYESYNYNALCAYELEEYLENGKPVYVKEENHVL